MKRSEFIKNAGLLGAGALMQKLSFAAFDDFPVVRTPLNKRKFTSPAIEAAITEFKKNVPNKELGWLFENCFSNTLDTTVDFEIKNGKPDTYVITGDIDAMWLRDSTAQVWPYLPFMKEDKKLQQLIAGVIRRQTQCILLDPYANAFYKDANKVSEWKETDITKMLPGIHERKWEIDSLCYPIRLAYGYWKQTGDASVFDKDWKEAMRLVLKTFKEQLRLDGNGPYTFQRRTSWATDGVPLAGYGYPTKKVGLIHSTFRPSDDATVFSFLIPSNIFAVKSLEDLANIHDKALNDFKASMEIAGFALPLVQAINEYGIYKHPKYGKIYAYETNGFGSYNLMDDSNVPSLLSLKYLVGDADDKTIYDNTRKFVLSEGNPFFFKGKAAAGVGSPHTGLDMIWPIGIIMRGLTSNNNSEIRECITHLQKTHASTGFMHESFHKDDPKNFTRKWFAWANTLFGEFLWNVYKRKPALLS